MKLLNNSRGDTIVEVMIAMAVASMVLGSAYTITNRSLANSLQAQEHAEALKLAQSQLEQLRSFAANGSSSDDPFLSNKTFCIATRNGTVQSGKFKQFLSDPMPLAGMPVNETLYPPECRNIGTVNYRTRIKYDPGSHTFSIFVNWDGPRGTGDQVSLVYKAYPGV